MNSDTAVYLMAGMVGVATAFMAGSIKKIFKMAESELLMLAVFNAEMAGILLLVWIIDCICMINNGERVISACKLPCMYMLVAVAEWIFCGLAVLHVKILKQNRTREE